MREATWEQLQIWNKILRIIITCKTKKQLMNARKMIPRSTKYLNADMMVEVLKRFDRKEEELDRAVLSHDNLKPYA